ncbi:hypothetical protein B0T18DRAFT_104123 [Schizothecium vesticola]|uniref:Uncharacterized protein n=1 Tax=Schizothecium vesticola TaxID=314040 RepID=A0AA40F1C0_9PEZI|nr:hypothetical protein B0T18DRAFT_104123 [Schizothecium vesticola]
MRTCPRTRSFVPRSGVWSQSGVCSWTGRILASGYGYSARVQTEPTSRRGGRLGLCLAVSRSGPRSSSLGCLAPTPPRVKRKRRHPMCITKNAAQQATTQPRSHSPTHGPKCPTSRRGGGEAASSTHTHSCDPLRSVEPSSPSEPRSPSSPDGDSRRAKRVPSPALPPLVRIYWLDDKRLFGSSRLQEVPNQERAITHPSPTVLRLPSPSRAYSPAAIGSFCARGKRETVGPVGSASRLSTDYLICCV